MGRNHVSAIKRGRQHSRKHTMLVAMLVPFVLACTLRHGAVASGGDPMTITQDQIEQLRATNAYEVVQLVHGGFFHSRGRESMDPNIPPTPVHVFLDDTYYGDVNVLQNIPIGDIEEIRLYQSYDAEYKFGSGHLGGVIQVITKH
jgi:hypothetical protein